MFASGPWVRWELNWALILHFPYLGSLRKPLEVTVDHWVSMKNVPGPSYLVVLSRKSFPSSLSVQSLWVRPSKMAMSAPLSSQVLSPCISHSTGGSYLYQTNSLQRNTHHLYNKLIPIQLLCSEKANIPSLIVHKHPKIRSLERLERKPFA